MPKKKDKVKSSHPWRDNIEAITISIVIIVLFKYFILEAYKIPTGSMQPTLMGWDNGKGGGVFDRVLVDKLSYQFRDPERFEVTVFKYPLDKSKNFIKRLWGMPGEDMKVEGGDVFVKEPGSDEDAWAIPVRSDKLLESMLRRLKATGEWHVPSRGWQIKGDDLIASTGGQAQFPRTQSTVKDHYGDGYPGKLGPLVERGKKAMAKNDVGDLRIETTLCPTDDCREIEIEFREGLRRYRLQVPGPKAAKSQTATLLVTLSNGDEDPVAVRAEKPFSMEAGKCYDVQAQNIDNRVRLSIDGEVLIDAAVPTITPRELTDTGINLRTTGGGAEFQDIAIWRDIYYTSLGQNYTQWTIPEGHYLMMGDNTQDSSDSRDWMLGHYRVVDEDGERDIYGNLRKGENPRTVPGGEDGSLTFFMDDLGERHVFKTPKGLAMDPAQASFVPRDLIRGRAVVVVWPIVPSLDTYRLRWVR